MFNFFSKTGNLIRFSILISLFLIINCADFNFNSIKGIKIKEIGEIQKLLDETDMTYFAFYYKETSENSKKVGELLQKIAIKLDYLTVILLIDCDQENFSDVEMCRIIPDVKDGYPRMEVYSPPEYKYNPYTKQMLKHSVHRYDKKEVGENLIYNFITAYIPARVTKLDPENFENFVNNLDLNKVILFTDKEKTPLLLRGLSNYFYDKLLFGEVGKHETSLLKKFKVKIFPTLIMYQTHEDEILLDEPKIELYDGPINAGYIVSFLEKFALKERISDLKKKQNDDPSKLKYKVAFKVLKHNEVISYMNKYNERRFVVYLDNNLEKDSISNDLKKFNRETNGFFHFLRINCVESPESQDFCKMTFKVKEFPKLILYNIKKNVKDINTRLEQGRKELSLDFSEIYSEINREIQSEITVTDPQSFTVLLNQTQVKDRVPVIYFFENDEVPLALQLLSTEKKFKKFAEFISLENPPRSLVQNFKFTKLPKLFILLQDKEKPGQARILVYEEELVYSRLHAFINQYFNMDRNSKVNQVEEQIEEDIGFIEDKNKFDINCKMGRKLCVLAFLDGRTKLESQTQFRNSMNLLENVHKESLKRNRPTSFAWVNATCHTEFSGEFNINPESLPNAVVYIPSKNLFANFIGTFEQDNLLSFIDKVLQGKVALNKIDESKLKFSSTPCESIKESSGSDSDDELLREIIEEEKIKREEFEKERQKLQEESKGKKKKKKKNKNKKSEL